MSVPFDYITSRSDSSLTTGLIAQWQRKFVWEYLEKITPQLNGFEILELNFGTGDEALMFTETGFNVVATDVSEETSKVTKPDTSQYSLSHRISSHYLDLENFHQTLFNKKFDLIFTDLGVINGIDPSTVEKLLHNIPLLLAHGGRFIAVVKTKFCLWESVYHLLKLQPRKAFRRWTSRGTLMEPETFWKTWYYTPVQLKKWSRKKFKLVHLQPIGLALPPASLEKVFLEKKRMLHYLARVDRKIKRFTSLSAIADHFIIDLTIK